MKFKTNSKERWLRRFSAWFVDSSHIKLWSADLATSFSANIAKSNFKKEQIQL